MHSKAHSHSFTFGFSWSPANAALTILLTLLLLIFIFLFIFVTVEPAQGQTYTVLHNFTGGVDGAGPDAGLFMDNEGNLYGTTGGGGYTGGSCGTGGCGTVFKLSKKDSGWILIPLYNFQGSDDGWCPEAVPTVGPDGNVYGTTTDGSPGGSPYSIGSHESDSTCNGYPCGTVYKLTPSAHASPSAVGLWTHTVLHHFAGYPTDGNQPYHSPVTFSAEGSMYLTTYMGGTLGVGGGTVVRLMPSGSGWTESIIYSLGNGTYPVSGVIFDPSGNLYGTTLYGEGIYSNGTVFQLKPSGNGWTQNILHTFESGSDGGFPMGGLIFDPAGNLYGTTSGGNYPYPSPTVFEMTYGSWNLNTLYSFSPLDNSPIAGVARDAAGNLYGTAYNIGGGCGVVFKLTPGQYGWTYTTLYDFPNGNLGCGPRGGVVVDANGNVYSTTSGGGTHDAGVVFEISP